MRLRERTVPTRHVLFSVTSVPRRNICFNKRRSIHARTYITWRKPKVSIIPKSSIYYSLKSPGGAGYSINLRMPLNHRSNTEERVRCNFILFVAGNRNFLIDVFITCLVCKKGLELLAERIPNYRWQVPTEAFKHPPKWYHAAVYQ